jgi:predicted nuclease with TOPRIM domain
LKERFHDVKYLVENVINTTKKVIKDYAILRNENSELYQKLEKVYISLKENRSKNLLIDEKIDSLLSYMSILSTALENKDTQQIKAMKHAIIDFWTLNQERLKLISIGGTNLYNLIKVIRDLF